MAVDMCWRKSVAKLGRCVLSWDPHRLTEGGGLCKERGRFCAGRLRALRVWHKNTCGPGCAASPPKAVFGSASAMAAEAAAMGLARARPRYASSLHGQYACSTEQAQRSRGQPVDIAGGAKLQ